jgi:hypothetical protein
MHLRKYVELFMRGYIANQIERIPIEDIGTYSRMALSARPESFRA